ncbi:hypothetical protein [Faecalibacter sp. LW9]|uniref:hypothetical protein n=1 Tax=Faecalibacter sp. LW9 TaxID=3103144 RepID=UPI002B0007D8|nr:hypothetical protein [Faecalibacter sp. LW9]
MILVSQIDGLFEIDLINTKISITEENNWFTDRLVSSSSLPEELPYEIHPFFLQYQSDNAEDYEVEFDVIFNDFGTLHKAKFEIIALHEYTFEFSIFYGWENFPNWDKKLIELDLPLISTDNIYTHANAINATFYPENEYYFPCIHTEQYSQQDLNYASFKGSYNLQDENGNFYINSMNVEENQIFNYTILRPNLYWLSVLNKIISQAGYQLEGDIVNDDFLQNLLVLTSRKYEQPDRPETIEWIVGLESYVKKGVKTPPKGYGEWGQWTSDQQILHFGKFRLKGIIKNWDAKYVDVFCRIYLDNVLIYSKSGRNNYDVNIEFTTKTEGSILRIEAVDYQRNDEKTDLKIIPIEVYNQDGSIINYVIESAVIDLKNSLPDARQGEFIETTMRWFNYDFTVTGNKVIMNKIEKILRRKRNAVDWRKFEVKGKNRTTDSGDSYLLKFKDQSNEKYVFSQAFVTKNGIQTENFKTNDNTKEIVINTIPLPVTSKNNKLSATIINDDDSTILAGLRSNSTTDNTTLEMSAYLIPNIYELCYKAFLKFRIMTMQYEWEFACSSVELEQFDIKREVFCYDNNQFIKQITREKLRGQEDINVQTYMIR